MSGFVLDAYAARSCPVKTQNAFLPGLARPEVADESLQELFHGGQPFKQQTLELITGADGVVDCRPLRHLPWAEQVEAAVSALRRGTPVVIGGVLPLDLDGHRSGRADLWVRGADTDEGTPGYLPVCVKLHRVLERITPGPSHEPVPLSTLADPALAAAALVAEVAVRLPSREADLIQLAHYWRLLQAAGFAAGGSPWGGLAGTDTVGALGNQRVISWVPLDRKLIRTFSRTAATGWTRRSALERYDHEQGFRVRVATIAMAQTGEEGDPPLAVTPIRVRECDRCLWWQVCRPQLGDDDLSLRIAKSPLDVREIAVLRRLGVATLTDLATVDLDDLLPRYLPEVAHRPAGEERLRTAAHRAQLMVDGVELERIGDEPVEVPGADIEIDLDIETSAEDRVYLWGFLVTDTRSGEKPVYVEFSEFVPLTDHSERALGARALGWLKDLVETSAPATVRVYHYSSYEVTRIQRMAGGAPWEPYLWAAGTDRYVDLFEIVRSRFFGTYGLGLKQVAHAGAGFEWRDDDPGGLNSQTWFDDAVSADDPQVREESRRRVLDYNEDDVRATHALRAWLRSLP